IELSKLYIDITKDRVYTAKSDGFARRSAQSAMYIVLDGLTKLVAPLIAFTGEEIWQAMPHSSADKKESVFLNDMPAYNEAYDFADVAAKWDKQFELRDDVMKALELARAEKLIGKSLDAKLTIYAEDAEVYNTLKAFEDELATIYIASGVKVVNGKSEGKAFKDTESGIEVLVEQADGHKCDRCWAYSTEGEETEDGGFICAKCKAVIEG
ncbi:MAG: class I tRNA ligase family protein, partial [Clostridia bacterium]|nr:class I tRNA ligase family protein [Clostridia bacterium]